MGFIGTQSLSRFFIILISPVTETSKILFCRHPHGPAPSPTVPCSSRPTWTAPSSVVQHRHSIRQPSNTGSSPSFGAAYITWEQPSVVLPSAVASPAKKSLTRCFHAWRPSFGLAPPQGAWVLQPRTGRRRMNAPIRQRLSSRQHRAQPRSNLQLNDAGLAAGDDHLGAVIFRKSWFFSGRLTGMGW